MTIRRIAAGSAPLLALILAACQTESTVSPLPPASAQTSGAASRVLGRSSDVVVVQVAAGDDAADLAKRYLGDARKAWRVASLETDGVLRPGTAAVVSLRGANPDPRRADGKRVPILCYHRFTNGRATRMDVPAATFERQLRYLRDNGYTVISLDDLAAFLNGQAELPSKPVVLTIDDGYRSTYEIAYPLLRRYGVPATVFVYTDFIGAPDALTPAQMREMRQSGLVDLQSHTKTHGDLRPRGRARTDPAYRSQVQQELGVSRDRLSALTGERPSALAYPYGAADGSVMELTAGAGYSLGLTLLRGGNASWTNPLLLHRDMVFGVDTLDAFARRVAVAAPPSQRQASR